MMTELRIKEIIRETTKKVLNEEKKSAYGPNGYRIVKGGMDFTVKGKKKHSAVSVANHDNTMIYHVVEDDHCYTFYVTDEGESEQYQYPYLFDEFYEAFKTLPPLS